MDTPQDIPTLSPTRKQELSQKFQVDQFDGKTVVSFAFTQSKLVGIAMMISNVFTAVAFAWFMGLDSQLFIGLVWGSCLLGLVFGFRTMRGRMRIWSEEGQLIVVHPGLGMAKRTGFALGDLNFEVKSASPNGSSYVLLAKSGETSAWVSEPSRDLELIRDIAGFYRETLALRLSPNHGLVLPQSSLEAA